jgi:RimJ/RimL family protein N-acetyltransferase
MPIPLPPFDLGAWKGSHPAPVTLEGRVVRLEPLSYEHEPDLLDAAQSDEIWRVTLDDPRTPALMHDYVARALRDRDAGLALPFAVRHVALGRVIGSTRYHSVAHADRGIEIGFTWYAPEFWRSAVNTECKYLLMTHAFERLGCIRVELKTDARNARSRAAILRLGAKEEGTLRSKVIMRDGHRRDSVYFSVLDHEWPDVKARLQALLARRSVETGSGAGS